MFNIFNFMQEMEKMIGARLDKQTLELFDGARSRLGHSISEAIREAIGLYVEHAKGVELIKIRSVPKEKAKLEIREYLKSKERAWTGDIADELRLDYELVMKCIEELEAEGLAEEI
jgi:hypothetical protein